MIRSRRVFGVGAVAGLAAAAVSALDAAMADNTNDQDLIAAARQGDLVRVQSLVKMGANPRAVDTRSSVVSSSKTYLPGCH